MGSVVKGWGGRGSRGSRGWGGSGRDGSGRGRSRWAGRWGRHVDIKPHPYNPSQFRQKCIFGEGTDP